MFPAEVRKELGKAIWDMQNGDILGMPLSRPLPSLERGAAELRLRDKSGIYRVLYFTRSLKGVLVFHAFVKKSEAIPKHEIDLARKRLKELMNEEI